MPTIRQLSAAVQNALSAQASAEKGSGARDDREVAKQLARVKSATEAVEAALDGLNGKLVPAIAAITELTRAVDKRLDDKSIDKDKARAYGKVQEAARTMVSDFYSLQRSIQKIGF